MAALLSHVLSKAQAFLLDPPAAPSRPRGAAVAAPPPRSVEVVVLGLSRGSGASTVAKGLVACLARGGREARLTALEGAPSEPCRALDVRDEAPVAHVWDVACAASASYGDVSLRADAVVLVAPSGAQPALAELVARTLAQRLGPILLVANRVRSNERWQERAAVCLPESRIGAALAARGRRPGGAFGSALASLAAVVDSGAGA